MVRTLRRLQRSVRKRYVRFAYGDKPFVCDYLGANFYVRTDNIIGREIAYRSFERDRLEGFMAMCKAQAPSVFIDVGANCGVYSCVLLKNALVQRAVMFEPDRRNAILLKENRRLNGLEGVAAVFEVAVGREPQELTLIEGPAENTGQSRLVRIPASGAYRVPVVRLDDVIGARGQTIALKMDVEGFELEALAGAEQLLRENRGVVQIESYDHAPEVRSVMEAAGFELVKDLAPDFVFAK